MKKTLWEPVYSDEEVIVQFTDAVSIDKSLYISVPDGYVALVYVDEKVQFRIEPCSERRIADYGRELLGKTGSAAFVRTKALSAMAWGFGNIQVNNVRLKEAYRVGANGKYAVELANIPKLIAHFDNRNNITVETVRNCTVSLVKNIGTALLANYFAGTEISVFEIAAHAAELRGKLYNALRDEAAFSSLGLALKDLTVDGIHVPEEDLDRIRSRINETEKDGNKTDKELLEAQKKFIADLSRKVDEKFELLRKQAEAKQDSPDISEQMRALREELTADLSERLGGKMQEMQDAFADSMDERLQEFLPLRERAKAEYLKTLKMTADFLIDLAKDEDELAAAAGMIYTNVEENLIKKFRLCQVNKKFAMDYDDYCALSQEAPGLLSRYDASSPVVLREDKYGEPEQVEIPPQVRFYKAGLSVEDAQQAKEYWCFMNKLRHKSPENDKWINDRFGSFAREKDNLVRALVFFREHGLYTKD